MIKMQKWLKDNLNKLKDALLNTRRDLPCCLWRELPLQYEKLIVLDATIGQNAITQAEIFSKAINLTGIILAKLDSSANGGVVLNIMNELSLEVKYIGTGEKIDDLAEFSFDGYLEGLLM